jgi:pSer/pThr/pTyr-binding forkhead associated (FHA) protein
MRRFPLKKTKTTIGCYLDNTIILSDCNPYEVEIVRENELFFLHSRSSAGVLVNGVLTRDPIALQNGDIITLGDESVAFVCDSTGSFLCRHCPGDWVLGKNPSAE